MKRMRLEDEARERAEGEREKENMKHK